MHFLLRAFTEERLYMAGGRIITKGLAQWFCGVGLLFPSFPCYWWLSGIAEAK